MRLFTQLFDELDAITRITEKVAALVRYFRAAEPIDAVWGLALLIGKRPPRAVSLKLLRAWLVERTGLPAWLVEESYQTVGDTAETLALLLPPAERTFDYRLHELIAERILALRGAPPEEQRRLVQQTWSQLEPRQVFLYHKLLLGGFRVGVARLLVARALAEFSGLPAETILHRLLAFPTPTPAAWQALLSADQTTDPGQPYPFYLASAWDRMPDELGAPDEWIAEWKWDGIRAQLIRRAGETMLWTRGEELVTDRYPEIIAAAAHLPDGVVLDGEILAWSGESPLPFQVLQRRIGRRSVTRAVLRDAPVILMVYDLLECAGVDWRDRPLTTRRERLEQLLAHKLPTQSTMRLSEWLSFDNWPLTGEWRAAARAKLCEGLMFKRRVSPYGVGRVRGDWWKWKSVPHSIDAVLVAAQPGHGRRAGLFTDYTFAVWNDGELLPIAKAYSGLSDQEIRQVDAFVRSHTTGRFGPVRSVTPELVFELHFEGVQLSPRHKSGIAVRFPRIARRRTDKTPAQADTLATLRQLAPAEPTRNTATASNDFASRNQSSSKNRRTARRDDTRQGRLFDE